jgi:hypothetical protein
MGAGSVPGGGQPKKYIGGRHGAQTVRLNHEAITPLQIRAWGDFEYVPDAQPRERHTTGWYQANPEHAEVSIQERHSDGKPHADRVYGLASDEEHPLVRREPPPT